MLDYTFKDKEYIEKNNGFLLNYEVKGDKIILHYSDHEYAIPYSEENEKKLLSKMENQVKDAKDYKEKLKDELKSSKNGVITLSIPSIFILVIIFLLSYGETAQMNINELGPTFVNVIKTVLALLEVYCDVSIIKDGINIHNISSTLKDIKKNELLVRNQEKLNKMVKENTNFIDNSKSNVDKNISKDTSFNINNIDKVKLKELKQLIENMKMEDRLECDNINTKKLKKEL